MVKVTTVSVDDIYPIVEKAISKNTNSYKRYLQRFLEQRSKSLYDIVPCDRIFYGSEDEKSYFQSIKIDSTEIKNKLTNAYFWNMDFNPRSAKSPLVQTQMMIIRYYLMKNDQKSAEISAIYLAFTGQFYPSIHSQKFPYPPPRHIMEYVVNNMLTQKFDLKREGTVFGAVKSICKTWLDTYKNKLIKSPDDEDIADVIQQLHGRLKSFMGNLLGVFKEAHDKQLYVTYDSDNTEEENFRLADNDSLRAGRYVENTMNYITSHAIDYQICRGVSDTNVRVDEVKSIIESIQDEPNNLVTIKELIGLIITDYMSNSSDKRAYGQHFIASSIVAKPNNKNKNVLRQKQIIENWLTENSAQYRKRKSREATKSSYHKSLLRYYVFIIHKANNGK